MPELPDFNLERLNLAFDGKKPGRLSGAYYKVFRAKVPGGWLIFTGGGEGVSGVAFYPDPKHEWTGGTLD